MTKSESPLRRPGAGVDPDLSARGQTVKPLKSQCFPRRVNCFFTTVARGRVFRRGLSEPLIAAACVLLGAQAGRAADPTAQELADQLTGDAAGDAADNPQCGLFTVDEIAGYLGAPVGPGANAGMGMGCQWLALDDDGDVMIMVLPVDYAERPTLAPGFTEAPAIGPDAFVVPEMGGFAAGTTTGDSFVKVSVAGPAADEARALALLAETIARRNP